MLRRLAWTVLGLLAACGGSESTNPTPPPPPPPVAPPPPPPPGSPLTIVATGSLPAAGGTLTVSKPGSPVDGMQLALPAGALTAPLSVTLGYRPLGPALPDGLTAISPVITISSDGPAVTEQPYTLKVPVTLKAGDVPMAVVYDTTRGFVSIIPIPDFDATSATLMTTVLDGADMLPPDAATAPGAAVRGGGSGAVGAPATLLVTIVTGPTNPVFLHSLFILGEDDWEFATPPNAFHPSTAAGQVLSEWQWPTGHLYDAALRAPGVPSSNPGGIILTAGLSKEFDTYRVAQLRKAPQLYPASARRHQNQLASIQTLMRVLRQPVPLLLLDAAGNYTMVLVITFDPQGPYFRVADPAIADNALFVDWNGSFMRPYSDIDIPARIYTEPVLITYSKTYHGRLNGQVAQVLSPTLAEDFVRVWPKYRVNTWDDRVPATTKLGADTVFMLQDTTRFWVSSVNPAFQESTTLPLPGGEALQPMELFTLSGGAAVKEATTPGLGTFLDYRGKVTPANPWIVEEVGVNARRLDGPASPVWLGWQRYTLVKYGIKVKPVRAAPGIPTAVSVNTLGGPQLPGDAVYEWDFNDGTAKVRVNGSASVQHTWAQTGSWSIDLMVYRPDGTRLAKTTSLATVDNLLSITQSPNFTLDPNQLVTFAATYTGPNLAFPLWMWHMGDGTTTSTTTPTVQYAYGLPAPLTSKTYTMTLELFNGDTLVATSSIFPRVSNGAMQAWRIETFTQVGAYTGFNPGTPAHYMAAVNYQDGYLSQVRTTPGDGFLLLQPPGSEQGIFFEVVKPGTGNTVTYYQTGAFLAMVARTQGNGSFFVNGGNDHAGTINGAAYFGLQAPPGQTAGAFLNLITAVKTGDVLTGTLTFKLDPSWGGAVRVFNFKANRVN